MQTIAQRLAARDLQACLALADARKAENVAARRRMQSNAELCAALLESAKRRGESAIDWEGYFRNLGV